MARWLLMASDYSGSTRFPLTQEVISQMLGVYRPAVTLAARLLQADGAIEYRRGIMSVRDRPGLEFAACDCYRELRDEYESLLPPE